MPRWSPDGRCLAVGLEREGNPNIYVLDLEGSLFPRRLTYGETPEAVSGWSRDGNWIYFFSDETGEYQVWKVSVEGGDPIQVTKNGGVLGEESEDGHLYYLRLTDPWSIWRIPVEGGEEELVVEKGGLGRAGFVFWRDSLVYSLENEPGGPVIERLDLKTFEVQRLAELGPTVRLGKYGRITVSPDGQWIAYPQLEGRGSDLVLVENFF
jgi:dipeptidyl aminopeptidase/acylaminoacyl peptidase